MSLRTPSKKASKGNTAPMTPFRSLPADRDEFHELNRRLEMYILKIREREAERGALGRGLGESDIDEHNDDILKLKEVYETQIDEYRRAKDAAVEDNNYHRHELEAQKKKADQLGKDLVRSKHAEDSLKSRVKELEGLQRDMTVKNAALQRDKNDASKKLARTADELTRSQGRLVEEQARSSQYVTDLTKLKNELAKERENFRTEILDVQNKNSELQKRLKELESNKKSDEERLRTQTIQELKKSIEDHNLELNTRSKQLLEERKKEYDQQIQKLNAEIEGLRNSLAQSADNLQDSENDRKQLESKLKSLLDSEAGLKKRVAQLQGERDKEAAKHAGDISRLNDLLAKVQDEVNELRNANGPLVHAIEEYERLVKGEEARLGIDVSDM